MIQSNIIQDDIQIHEALKKSMSVPRFKVIKKMKKKNTEQPPFLHTSHFVSSSGSRG